MVKFPALHERRLLWLLFLVCMLLHLSKTLASSLKVSTTRCIDKERKALYDIQPVCANKYSHNLSDCCTWPGIYCSNLTGRIRRLVLGDNLLSGEIPEWIGHMLPNLTIMSLRNNSFTGSIPPQICHLSSLSILDLSSNNISGMIPNCLCNLTAMTQKKSLPFVILDTNDSFSSIGTPYNDYVSLVLKGFSYEYKNHLELVKSMDLSSNKLGGNIPVEVSCLTGLVSLNFSGNDLIGPITSKISQLKSLESLDLSNNQLTGVIPATLSDLNFLGTLSLANNNLSGRIPTGTQLLSLNTSSFEGNPGLCGEPLPNKCPGDGVGKENGVNEGNYKPNDEKIASLGLYISIVLGYITGFWGVCGVLVFKRSWRYAYFRVWNRAYDKFYVMVTLMMARIQRRFQV